VLSLAVRILRFFLLSACLCGVLLAGPLKISAQWNYLWTFHGYPSCIFFFPGANTVGLIGCEDGRVYRTTNSGATWSACTITGNIYEISNFAFLDANTGWLSIMGPDLGSYASCYKTTDGGVTWNPTSATGPKSSVFYNKVSGRVFLTGWFANLEYSSDLGSTWTLLPYITLNGAAFINDSIGVIGSKNSSPFIRTTDGGVTWARSPLVAETWQSFAEPCSNTLFALSEILGTLNRSDDSGKSWYTIYSGFGNYPGQSSGTIVGDNTCLLTQTADGLYISVDQGQTWSIMSGGPAGPDIDTRFYYGNGVIYAADILGRLFSYSVSVAPNAHLLLTNDTVAMQTPTCTAIDTSIRLTGPELCQSSYIYSVTPLDSSDFTIKTSVPLPSSDEPPVKLLIHYNPNGHDSTGTRVRVRYSVLTQTHDTVIYLSTVKTLDNAFLLPTGSVQWVAPTACVEYDTTLKFVNRTCDTLWIQRASLPDSIDFHVLTTKFPIVILPGDTGKIKVSATPIVKGPASTWLDIHFQNQARAKDTLISLALNVLSASRPQLPVTSINFQSLCTPFDTSFEIRNPGCDTLIITAAQITGVPDFSFSPITFPIKVPPGDSVALPIVSSTSSIGKNSGGIALKMTLHGAVYDTILRATFTVNSGLVSIATTPATPDAGTTSICTSKEITVIVQNPLCDLVTLDSLKLAGDTNSFSFVKAPVYPRSPVPGGYDTLVLKFAPPVPGVTLAAVKFYYKIDGQLFDTSLTVRGTGSLGLSASFADSVLKVDTLQPCISTATLSSYFVNTSCDSVRITSLHSPAIQHFVILQPQLPQWVHSGDSALVRVEFEHGATGAATDSLVVQYTDSKGNSGTTTLALSVFIAPNISHASLSAAKLQVDSLAPCSTFDSVFIFRNISGCDSIRIDSIAFAGSSEILLSGLPKLPLTLQAGDSVSFVVAIIPGDHQTLSGNITIGGPDIDTAIPVAATSRASNNRALSLVASQPRLVIARCDVTTDTAVIVNGGCGTMNIDSISIAGLQSVANKYRILSGPKLPYALGAGDTVKVIFAFDASAAGDSVGVLTVGENGIALWKQVTIQGTILPPLTAHLELKSVDGSAQASAIAGANVTVVSDLLEKILAPLNLQTVSFDLSYDDNVMTLTSLLAATGWKLTDSSSSVVSGRRTFHLLFWRTVAGDIAASSPVDTLSFRLAVGDSLSTGLSMTNLQLNAGDTTYSTCTLGWITPNSLPIDVIAKCGDSILSNTIRGIPLISQLQIRPNPAGHSGENRQAADLHFSLAADANISIEVSDALGHSVSTPAVYRLRHGAQAISLDLTLLPAGSYFVSVRGPQSEGVTTKLMIER
jgi:photosystem II stability/assembly factor-like uncharacterized protein